MMRRSCFFRVGNGPSERTDNVLRCGKFVLKSGEDFVARFRGFAVVHRSGDIARIVLYVPQRPQDIDGY